MPAWPASGPRRAPPPAQLARSARPTSNSALFAARRGEAYLLAGRPDDAQEQAMLALELSTTRHERGQQAYALRLLAEMAARRDLPETVEAEARYGEALGLAEELGMRPLQAHCHLGLGMLYGRSGRPKDARGELSTAVEMLRQMDMTFWLPRAETELAEAGVSPSTKRVR